MDIKLIALDLDDTTLSKDGTLSEFNASAIKNAIENGVEVVVASGRNHTSLPESITSIPGIRYAIVSNGAAIYDLKENRRIGGYCLPESSVLDILSISPQIADICYEVVIDGTAYCEKRYYDEPLKYGPDTVSPHIAEYIKNTRISCGDIGGFARENADKLDCMNIVCKSADICRQLRILLEAQVKNVYLTSSVPHLLEISHAMAGKGNGLRKLCGILGISLSQTAACGNADNDADMLMAAGIGAAVKNATTRCIEASDVVIGDCSENGVGIFINELLNQQ